MEPEEKRAYLYGGQMAGEYLESIKKYNLAELSPDEWLTFCECMCKNYSDKYIEITTNLAFQF